MVDHTIIQSASNFIRDYGPWPRPHPRPLTLTPLALPLFLMLASIAPGSPVAPLCHSSDF